MVGMLTASINTKNSACSSDYLQVMTDYSYDNHFFLRNFYRLEFPKAFLCAHAENQNGLLLMLIPCSNWALPLSNGPGK